MDSAVLWKSTVTLTMLPQSIDPHAYDLSFVCGRIHYEGIFRIAKKTSLLGDKYHAEELILIKQAHWFRKEVKNWQRISMFIYSFIEAIDDLILEIQVRIDSRTPQDA